MQENPDVRGNPLIVDEVVGPVVAYDRQGREVLHFDMAHDWSLPTISDSTEIIYLYGSDTCIRLDKESESFDDNTISEFLDEIGWV